MADDVGRLRDRVDDVARRIDDGYADDPHYYSRKKKIRGAIWGFHHVSPPFLTLLDSPFLQRLRYIYQTAFAHSTYLSSHHNRFEHSVGVFTTTKEMLAAIESNCGMTIEEPYRTETKLAALLHDIGHGPFSHASEEVYGRMAAFSDQNSRFLDAAPSEILAYCLIESSPVRSLLEDFEDRTDVGPISRDRISDMIMGHEEGLPEGYQFLRYVINGPVDADKFDYVNRDGFFTDLDVSLDTERLLHGLELSGDRKRVIVDSGSLSALEQVSIGKAQLYSQVYHHQKIRAAAAVIHRLLIRLREIGTEPVPGFSFDDPATYLLVDDTDVLGGEWDDAEVDRLIGNLKDRVLPKRALVLTYPCFPDIRDESLSSEEYRITNNWSDLRRDLRTSFEYLRSEERTILGNCSGQTRDVLLDIPAEPPGSYDEDRPLIQLGRDGGEVIKLNKVFPAESWANAYEAYRSRSYVFAEPGDGAVSNVTEGALKWLDDHGVRVKPIAVREAKVSPADISWDRFLEQ